MSEVMEFKDFLEKIINELPAYLSQFDIDKIHVEEICKNNGIIYTSLVIALQNENMSPSIYMDYFYEMYKQGKTIENIVEKICEEYKKARKEMVGGEISIPDKEQINDKVFLKIINYECNKNQLEECPYVPYHDLAITFRYLVKHDENGIASALVRTKDMEEWGLTLEKLYEIAKENTRKIFPPVFKRLDDMLKEFDNAIEIPEGTKLHILTNEQGINGATCMIYEDVLKEFAKNRNADIYILPSSIHEVLLLPCEDGVDRNELEAMVKEINEYVVSPLEFLSNTVYTYDFREFCVKI